jgi:hypothetical protein
MSVSAITGSSVAYSSNNSQSVTNGQGTVLAASDQSSAARTIDTDEVSIVSLNQNPATQPAITQSDQLSQGLADAVNAATIVDPVTGQRELLGGAANTLASTLDTLLTQNGFNADDVKQAVTGLVQQITKNGTGTLSLGFGSTVTNSETVAGANGSGTAAAGEIQSSSYSARFVIGVNLDSGKVGVDIQSQSATSEAAAAVATGSAASDGLQAFLSGADGGVAEASQFQLSVSSDVVASLNLTPSQASPAEQLVQNLLSPTVANSAATAKNVQHLAGAAAGAKVGIPVDPASLPAGTTLSPDGSKATTAVDVTTPVAIRQNDGQGYGSTLYRRPDGSLGSYTLRPVRISA